jgi:hypothetical protein
MKLLIIIAVVYALLLLFEISQNIKAINNNILEFIHLITAQDDKEDEQQ